MLSLANSLVPPIPSRSSPPTPAPHSQAPLPLLHASSLPPPRHGAPQVTQVKTVEGEGYTSMQLGCGSKKPKQVTTIS